MSYFRSQKINSCTWNDLNKNSLKTDLHVRVGDLDSIHYVTWYLHKSVFALCMICNIYHSVFYHPRRVFSGFSYFISCFNYSNLKNNLVWHKFLKHRVFFKGHGHVKRWIFLILGNKDKRFSYHLPGIYKMDTELKFCNTAFYDLNLIIYYTV